ncbi:leucine-rich colipase-like protein 1 isoform X1 [Acinonyx jubatus]|uniref:Leucine-rich colipase-like protein 1 isoform X1 n=2 Tax=Acinonyx jubatus TaxID=32536 RepID=A0ABM3NRV1_ACIJB|nr:leucine-rich colipase-like protein 1 isoform X1 [Acinonyx jubatus]
MACARRLLLLLYLLPVSLAWRPKTVFHLHKQPGVTEALHHPDRLPPGPGPAEGARAGWPAPGGGGSRHPELAAEGAGGRRKERGLPSGGGQPNGHACSKHSECRSRCCVLSISGSELTCRPMTIFLQCQPWRKPNGSHCTNDDECQSRCCLAPTEVSHRRCVPQRGILVQCLILVSAPGARVERLPGALDWP